jgi:acyl carrier protein
MSETEVKGALRTWIIAKSKHAEASALTDETPILEKRILSSLQVMDLILYIEQLSKAPMDPESLKPGVFSSVNRIYDTFFQGKA